MVLVAFSKDYTNAGLHLGITSPKRFPRVGGSILAIGPRILHYENNEEDLDHLLELVRRFGA